jgi:hypothetical protein
MFMARAVEPTPAPDVPMTFRDFPAEVPVSEPVAVAVHHLDPVTPEPAKPATKKEN